MKAVSASGTKLDTSKLLSPGVFSLEAPDIDHLIAQIKAMLERFAPEGTEPVTRNERP